MLGFLVFSHLEVAYISSSRFVIMHVHSLVFIKLLEISSVSFYFTAFVNKVLFLSLVFIFSLLSLLSLFLSCTFPAAKHFLEDDNSRYVWLGLLSLKRKEASLVVGLGMLSS